MKNIRHFLSLGLFLLVTIAARSQSKPLQTTKPDSGKTIIRICAPSRSQLLKPVLYVIYKDNKVRFKDTSSHPEKGILANIDPQSIKNITVLKDERSIKLYGDSGRNGVVLIYLKDSSGIKN